MTYPIQRALPLLLAMPVLSLPLAAQDAPNSDDGTETITVIADRLFQDTAEISPSVQLSAEDLKNNSFITVEDGLKHVPSLVVRRRYIGDANGVIGIRGTNMFQGTRSMVFADGMPLHYHLQTRWAGAPRWSLISPGEVDSMEVIYGPFSAEYSGNAMGGVVNIQSRVPESRRLVLEGGLFSQQYEVFDQSNDLFGGKAFIAYEDKIGDLALFTSYHRLQNDGQPQSQFRSSWSGKPSDLPAGAKIGKDEYGASKFYYGDSGPEKSRTELYKVKLHYDLDDIQLRSTLAYEERQRDLQDHNSYLSDGSYSGSNFQHRHQQRNSLLIGAGVSGLLGESDWVFDAFVSQFAILDDEEVRTARNPLAEDYQAQNASYRGRLTHYDDTGWQIMDVKVGTESLGGDDNQRLSLGVHLDSYELNLLADDYNAITGQQAADELDGNRATGRKDSGGKAATQAFFAQYGYNLNQMMDIALGLRYEHWQTKNGYLGAKSLDKRSDGGWSPKVSVGYFPSDTLTLRYSVARALRMPIVEELYRNDDKIDGGASFISDPSLSPEDGVFHNLSLKQQWQNSQLTFNLFYDVVEDVIFNQVTTTDTGSVSTSLPVDEVTSKGMEVSYEYDTGGVWRFKGNASYINAEITRNRLNPAIEGKDFPRMPHWRVNLQLGYQVTNTIALNLNSRYASNSHGDLDNKDTAKQVFGAQDGYLLLGAKLNWQVSEQARLSVGIDNLTDEAVYVHHPWPQRTFYLEGKYVFDNF